MSDEDNGKSGAEDQNEGQGDALDTKDATITGSDEGSQDDQSGDDKGEGDDAGFEQKFKDQQGRATKAEGEAKALRQRLIAAGLDPDTGKKKESRAPNKDGNALSDDDKTRITRSEERSERAALRSMGITHPDDIAYVRSQAKHFDGDVEKAAEDEFVKSKLERMQTVRKTKEATPDPSRRGGSARNTKLPDFSKMTNAEFDEWEKKNR